MLMEWNIDTGIDSVGQGPIFHQWKDTSTSALHVMAHGSGSMPIFPSLSILCRGKTCESAANMLVCVQGLSEYLYESTGVWLCKHCCKPHGSTTSQNPLPPKNTAFSLWTGGW